MFEGLPCGHVLTLDAYVRRYHAIEHHKLAQRFDAHNPVQVAIMRECIVL